MERLPDLLMRGPRVALIGSGCDLEDDLVTAIDRWRAGTTAESAQTGQPPLLPAGAVRPAHFLKPTSEAR